MEVDIEFFKRIQVVVGARHLKRMVNGEKGSKSIGSLVF